MINLYRYLCESRVVRQLVLEGGASGHMKHPYDYTEFTLAEIKELISNIFSGNVESVTEKVDGLNIQATRNAAGEVVFVRNQGDLDSERGGMTMSDMIAKWSDNERVLNTFISAGRTITEIFEKLPVSFFNQDGKRLYVNAECVIAGKTNIMPYIDEQVDFHDIWVYEYDNLKNHWTKVEVTKKGLDKIEKAAEGTKGRLTPQLIISVVEQSQRLVKGYSNELDKIFKLANLGDTNTIDDWKRVRFEEYCKKEASWILSNSDGFDALFRRWFNGDKSTNIKIIKSWYVDSVDALKAADDKVFRKIVASCMEPLDDFFIKLGTDVIKLCKGIINDGQQSIVVKQLIQDMNDIVSDVRKNGSVETNDKLTQQLNRLERIGVDNISAAEGIVFTYKGKMMKLTGAFAPLNQILGVIRFAR